MWVKVVLVAVGAFLLGMSINLALADNGLPPQIKIMQTLDDFTVMYDCERDDETPDTLYIAFLIDDGLSFRYICAVEFAAPRPYRIQQYRVTKGSPYVTGRSY